MVSIQFTIFFEEPFWVGLIEESSGDVVRVGRHVFGAEPSNPEIVDFVLHRLSSVELHPSSDSTVTTRRLKKALPGNRSPRKSLEIYKAAISVVRAEKKAERRREVARGEEEAFRAKQERKKRKRRGH